VHETATYRSDDTRGCVMQFLPPDDEHMCSKHVEAWNILIVKQTFCVSSWLITEINILWCTVSKTSEFMTYRIYYLFRHQLLFFFVLTQLFTISQPNITFNKEKIFSEYSPLLSLAVTSVSFASAKPFSCERQCVLIGVSACSVCQEFSLLYYFLNSF